jgi:hypothetical protein
MAVDFGQELADLDFENIIGGPLSAVVDAQADAAITSITFIQEVGLHKKEGEIVPIMTEFSYNRSVVNSVTGLVTLERHVIQVPVLSLLPIPFLQFADVWLDFNVSLNSISVSQSQVSHNLVTRGGYYGRNVRVSGSFSLQAKKSSTGTTKRSYDMHIDLHALQDDLPEGMNRVLSMLEQASIPDSGPPADGPLTTNMVLTFGAVSSVPHGFDASSSNTITSVTVVSTASSGTSLSLTSIEVTSAGNITNASLANIIINVGGSGYLPGDTVTVSKGNGSAVLTIGTVS